MLHRHDFERFMDNCRVELTGASDAGIKLAMFDTLKEFFADSNAWREHLHLLVTAGKQHYQLVARDQGRIIRLLGVWDGLRIPVAAFMPHPGTLEVRWPVQVSSVQPAGNPPFPPNAVNPWLVTVIENVQDPTAKEDVPICPAWTLELYSETIKDGVLGRMMAQPEKSYTNQTMSAYHLKRFRTGVQQARTAANRQNTVGAQTWSFPRVGIGRNSQRGGMVTAWPPQVW